MVHQKDFVGLERRRLGIQLLLGICLRRLAAAVGDELIAGDEVGEIRVSLEGTWAKPGAATGPTASLFPIPSFDRIHVMKCQVIARAFLFFIHWLRAT